MKMLSNSNQINESGPEVVKTLVIKIKEFSFYTGYLKKTGRDGLAYRVSIGGPQNLLVRRTNTSNRKGLPKRKELTVGKRGAPDAQRRAGFHKRKCPWVAKSEKSMNIQG